MKSAKDSYDYFLNLPDDCPYKFNYQDQVPSELDTILNSEESQREKEIRITELIKAELK